MKRIYNTITKTTVWRGIAFTIDGVPQTVDLPLIMLEEVVLPDPVFNPLEETLVRISRADITSMQWIDEATVRPLTQDELAAAARKVWKTSSDYLLEFEFSEMAAIELSQNPTIATLRLLMASWDGEVWSDDPRVLAGLQELVLVGILTQERANEILSKD